MLAFKFKFTPEKKDSECLIGDSQSLVLQMLHIN